MDTSVRTKVQARREPAAREPAAREPAARKPASAPSDADATRGVEQAALVLESAVLQVLEANKGHAFHDVDFLYWSRKLKSAAMPVSLALSELKGPKRFHYHYRHDPNDHEKLYPVVGPLPVDTLARVAQQALIACNDLVGVPDDHVRKLCDRFEQALRVFLHKHQMCKAA